MNVEENRIKLKQYQKLTNEELEALEKDESISYNDYVLVCIARGLNGIETSKTYTHEEVFAHLYEYINMAARSAN